MLRSLKPRTLAATVAGLSVSFALGCSEPASPTSVHGNTPGVTDGRANTIQVIPAAVSVEEGVKSALSCSAMDSRGVVLSASPTWASSDESVAIVNSAGAVLGQRSGTATISCSLGGKTANATVTVATSLVAFVEVSPGEGTLEVGNSLQLSGIPRDAHGVVVAGRDVQFTTADTNIAAVSPTGAVTARVEGTANVIAISGGKASLARINVSSKPVAPVFSVNLKVDDATLNVGKFTHATATTVDAYSTTLNGRSVIWSVGDPRVVSVVALNGDKSTITALAQGTTTVTATSEGKSATVTISVAGLAPVTAPTVAAVTVSLSSANILPGETSQATATVKDATGNVLTDRAVTWASLDPSIAVVSQTGLVTAINSGAVIIRATSDGKTADASLTVGVPPVALVAVNLASTTLVPGQTTQASAVAKDASGRILTGRYVSWSSSNTAIATVSISGVVTSKTSGSAAIRATVETAVGDEMLTVGTAATAVSSVAVTLASPSVAPGQTTQATAVAKDASGNVLTGRSVTWSSLTPGVATVSSTGLVTAVTAGSATIRATVETKTGDGQLTVGAAVPAAVAAVAVTIATPSIAVGQSTQASAVATDAGGAVLTGRSISWSSLNPAIATVSSTGLVTAVGAGSATIRATVDTKTGDGFVTVASASSPVTPGDAELPRVYLATAMSATPSVGRQLRVAAGGDLQRALDTAVAGDKILLAAGASFTGNFILRDKGTTGIAGGWITVQTDGALPTEGTRAAPSSSFPKIVSPNILPAIATNGPATRWRFTGVEVTVALGVPTNQGLIALGCPNDCESSTAQQPTDIVFDRTYVHGTSTVDVRRCFGFNGARLALVDSYVSDCHSGFDAQAVAGWNGPGPFKIVNNYLEGAAENIAFGGGDPSIANLVPSDIEIRRNHITKPMSWKGGPWLIKNLLELKVGRRVLIDGNVFENSWPHGQAGFAFVLWSVNQQGTCTWCVTEHVTITNNVIRNVAAAFNLTATGDRPVPHLNHLVIRNNAVIGLDNASIGGNGRIYQISDLIPNLVIEHNTAFSPSNSSFIWGAATKHLDGHIIRNNLAGGGQYQIFSPFGQGKIAWDTAGGTNSAFVGNVVVAFAGTAVPGNIFPAQFADIALTGGAAAATSPTATLNDLALAATSGYKGKATDGTDPGANMTVLSAAVAGVVQSGASFSRSPGNLRFGNP